MKTYRPLPLSVPPVSGECITSTLARAARRNGLTRLVSACSDLRLDYQDVCNGAPHVVKAVADLTGADPLEVGRNSPCLRDDDWFRLGHADIKFTAFRRTAPRVCPVCANEALAQGGFVFQRGIWQLSQIRSCPEHKCLLVDLERPARPRDVFDIPTLSSGITFYTVTYAVPTKLERHLLDRIAGHSGEDWFSSLPFHVAAQLAENFGLLLLHGPDWPRDQTTPHDWQKAGALGYAVLSQGPEAFLARLDDINAAAEGEMGLYRKRFRVFFEWLRNRDKDPLFDPIRDLMRDYIFETYPVAKSAIVLGIPNPKRRLHNSRSLAKEKQLNRSMLGHVLFREGYVKRGTGTRFIDRKLIPIDAANAITRELRDLKNTSQTAERLGISRGVLEDLTRHGYIKRYFEHQNAVPAYHRDEARRFYMALTANWLPKDQANERGTPIDLATAARSCKIALWQVFALIIENDIPISKASSYGKGIPNLRVHAGDIRAVLDRSQAGSRTFREAATELGIETDEVRRRIKAGELIEQRASEAMPNQRFRRVVWG